MEFARKILSVATAAAVFSAGVPAVAEPPEPLAVTRLADPDPNYVPPPPEPKHGRRHAVAEDADVSVDDAMAAFGRVVGQAMLAQRQMLEQKCKSTEAAPPSDAGRMAWEAACKYTRR